MTSKRRKIIGYLRIYKLKENNIRIKFYLINLWISIKIDKNPVKKVGINIKILLTHILSFVTKKNLIQILIKIVIWI